MRYFEYEFEVYERVSDTEVDVTGGKAKISSGDMLAALTALNQDFEENYGENCFDILSIRRVQQ